MIKVRILINDRNYESWSFQDVESNAEIRPQIPNFNPLEYRLFSNDIFQICESDPSNLQITSSSIRGPNVINAGVLQLNAGKTYGRTSNKKRLLYKCIPDDIRLPAFLIPYEPKIGFEKKMKNKYVVFRFDNWNDKHPHGILTETLGDVDSLEAFYEYQLYCKSLHFSINDITHQARAALNQKPHQEYIQNISKNPDFKIKDRKRDYVFTIDPHASMDFDDGFSITRLENGRRQVSVYIANVALWLETLGLWKSFSQRVATIYLPDRRRPMLPTVLSDALCSLQEGQHRFAFVMDLELEEDGSIAKNEIGEEIIGFSNAVIQVHKNYRYEQDSLYADPAYRELFDISKLRDSSIDNSHDVVAHWMVEMNSICSRFLMNKKAGIFRSVSFLETRSDDGRQYPPVTQEKYNRFQSRIHVTEDGMKTGITERRGGGKGEPGVPPNDGEIGDDITPECRRVIQTWKNTSGHYLVYSDDISQFEHKILDLRSYVHITSPIRRLVDLLNQMVFSIKFTGTSFSQDAADFISGWINKMEYVNKAMRSIRKIQNECELLHKCSKNPGILTDIYSGFVFDKLVKNDGSIACMVYLEKLNMISRIILSTDIVKNNSRRDFKLFLFEDEDKTKKKIRLHLSGI